MAGFSNINIDLMSGIPGQNVESWKNTLRKVIMLKPEHISAYSLIIEEGTPFGTHYMPSQEEKTDVLSGWPPLMSEEEDRQIYHLTKTILAEAGFLRYEISNYARQGYECRHNIGYWTGKDYLGFGLGASSCVSGCRFCNEKDLRRYMEYDFSAGELEELHGDVHRQSRKEQMEEFMFLGLRMMGGVSDIRFFREFGVHMESIYGEVIRKLEENGLLLKEGGTVRLSDWGIDVSNYVLGEFLLEL